MTRPNVKLNVLTVVLTRHNNYYIIKTNKGDVYRCEKCYEVEFYKEA